MKAARASRLTAAGDLALLASGLVIHMFVLTHSIWGDAAYRERDLQELLHGRLSAFKYSYAGPFFSTPLLVLDKLRNQGWWWLPRFNLFLLVAACAVLYAVMRDRIDRPLLRAFFLVLITGSMFPYHLTAFYGEVFSALAAGTGIVLLEFGYRPPGWVLLALGVWNMPPMAIGVGAVALIKAFEEKRIGHFIPLVAAAALVTIEAWLRRGSPLDLGYQGDGMGPPGFMPYTGRPGFSFPLLFGILGLLFSFGRGILFFAPGLWLSFFKRERSALESAYRLWMVALAGLVVVYAKWWSWHGSVFWGPRFHVFAAIPASYLVAAHVRREGQAAWVNLATLASLAAMIWVGIDGIAFGIEGMYPGRCNEVDGALCIYAPEFSPLFHPWVQWSPLHPSGWIFLAYGVAVFVWLGARPAAQVVRQATSTSRWFLESYGSLSEWRL
jgi:hypothetical protein